MLKRSKMKTSNLSCFHFFEISPSLCIKAVLLLVSSSVFCFWHLKAVYLGCSPLTNLLVFLFQNFGIIC